MEPNLNKMSPTGRTLYWYLRATGPGPIEVRHAATESGIPWSSIYQAIRTYPDTFVLIGSTVRMPSQAANASDTEGTTDQ